MTAFSAVIAGAGPVGLSLAVALATRGRRVCVLEAEDDLADEARASTFHPPTLEMFADWGVIDDVLARGRPADRLQFWERERRELVAELPYALLARDTPYPFRLQCPQNVVTRVLRTRLEALGGRVLFGHEVTAARDLGDEAELVACGQTFRAGYAVGTDGSKSRVRESLGLDLHGRTYPDRFLLVATDLDLEPFFAGLGPVAYVFDPDEWVIVMRLPDVLRIVFRLSPEADEAEVRAEPAVRARVARFLGREVPYQISSIATYSVHQRVAETFRRGRVLLAGDAAHINNPAGGMGMNSGIHDAHALAEALERAFKGEDSALDVWAATRRAVAVDGVQQQSDGNYKDLVARERSDREARDRTLREAAGDPAKARAYLLRASMMGDRVAARAG